MDWSCFLNQDFQDYGDFQDCDDAVHRFHPHPSPLPSRERGILRVVLYCCHPALWIPAYAGMTVVVPCRLTSGLRIKSAMT